MSVMIYGYSATGGAYSDNNRPSRSLFEIIVTCY